MRLCRCGQQQRQPELHSIDVLHLVDEQLAAAFAPARKQAVVVLERLDRAQDEVVEVEPARRSHRPLVGDEGLRGWARFGVGCDLIRGHAELQLQP